MALLQSDRCRTRAKFSFDRELVDELIGFLESAGSPTLAGPLAVELPDPRDQMLIEVAVSGGADFQVTGNLKHFPVKTRAGVRVVIPGRSTRWVARDRT